MLIAGIDEAGRGPALGPMVLAVACIEKKDEDVLLEIGVKDSKLLQEPERKRQAGLLKKALHEYGTVQIMPHEIDKLRDRKSLNEIEAMRIGLLLNRMKEKPAVIYVDAPDPLAKSFETRIRRYINFDAVIRSEHKADINYPIVSAASIIAKVERDAELKKLSKQYGELGSGYPHDPVTIAFMRKWVEKNKSLPVFARHSWETSKAMLNKKLQKQLGEFK